MKYNFAVEDRVGQQGFSVDLVIPFNFVLVTTALLSPWKQKILQTREKPKQIIAVCLENTVFFYSSVFHCYSKSWTNCSQSLCWWNCDLEIIILIIIKIDIFILKQKTHFEWFKRRFGHVKLSSASYHCTAQFKKLDACFQKSNLWAL